MTKEEALKILRKDSLSNLVDYYSSEELQDAIDTIVSQPSLPSNLDEAAFSYENNLWESGFKECGYSPQEVNDAFKAGAKFAITQLNNNQTIIMYGVQGQ